MRREARKISRMAAVRWTNLQLVSPGVRIAVGAHNIRHRFAKLDGLPPLEGGTAFPLAKQWTALLATTPAAHRMLRHRGVRKDFQVSLDTRPCAAPRTPLWRSIARLHVSSVVLPNHTHRMPWISTDAHLAHPSRCTMESRTGADPG